MSEQFDPHKNRNPAKPFDAPKDWQDRLDELSRPVLQTAVAKHLNMPLGRLMRCRKLDADFDAAVLALLRKPLHSIGRQKVPDRQIDIDEILQRLALMELSNVSFTLKQLAEDARLVIHQLQKQKRAALSRLNEVQTREHNRRSGAQIQAHATGSK